MPASDDEVCQRAAWAPASAIHFLSCWMVLERQSVPNQNYIAYLHRLALFQDQVLRRSAVRRVLPDHVRGAPKGLRGCVGRMLYGGGPFEDHLLTDRRQESGQSCRGSFSVVSHPNYARKGQLFSVSRDLQDYRLLVTSNY